MTHSPGALANFISDRVYIKGKFLYSRNKKMYIKGVTYGTFKPSNGTQYPELAVIKKDFEMMAANGINCVRTYTVPPLYLLDLASVYNLKVMVGLPWEQHITFLDDQTNKKDIVRRVQEGVKDCKKHSAILCYAIGNEIPASIVRWYGKAKIEAFLKELYNAAKEADPQGLVTYVNYPTTEYLNLSFLDFDCFNVYLETPEKLSSYISRLHNLCGERPLVLAEIGLDSLRNGDEKQAEVMNWQIKTVFGKGCAGMFVFAWTDEWWRGGFEIEDWNFGLVDRQRTPKPALSAVINSMQAIPLSNQKNLPFFSIVVCSYNGSATIKDTLEGLMKLQYGNYEVIVVDDGSKDDTANIVRRYPVKLISTRNKGLSSARNTGMYNAKGDIIAYIDDDAYPDPHWLQYLAYTYINSNHVAVGGPNIIPAEDGYIATCVANAPGGPVHVLATDEIAEHIPGCNFSVRKNVLVQVGGFDPVYTSAGDDVDVCWRIQEAGYTIGFHPSALVWHHRRNSLKAYWKQQKGYGKAEALLERKWPQKYNAFGHLEWAGRIYGNGFTIPIKTKKDKIFHGTWGSALFQSVYEPAEGFSKSIPLMPEWYLFSIFFGFMACLGFLWKPLLLVWPVFIVSITVIIIQAIISASKNSSLTKVQHTSWKYRPLIILLHIIQPLARLKGRITHGLTPWRMRAANGNMSNLTFFRPRLLTHWSEGNWKGSETWLEEIEQNLIALQARVKRGGDFDRWDIQTRNGFFSTAKGVLTIEEHGAQKQYLKFRYWVNYSKTGISLIILSALIAVFAALDHSWVVSFIIAGLTIGLIGKYVFDCASVANCLIKGFTNLSKEPTKTGELKFIDVADPNEVENASYVLRKEGAPKVLKQQASKI
ncbi:glycosyltransferase [Segetibacter koreensis]|uniref:glycosyltransferase n=1 Tax=Segetibacter koreensis TaxID=398037 RepID=UPI0024802231|nr:glycosyltransferase [Segetibacter koreensis]